VNKECPHCHAASFGWRELFTLNSFSPKECRSCGGLVRNSGWRQLLAIPVIIATILTAFAVSAFLPPEVDFFLLPITVIVSPLVLALLAKPVKADPEQSDRAPFTPDPNNDKAILIQGWTEDELRQILDDFVEGDITAFDAFRIEVRQRFEDSFALTFPEDIHPDEFIALINYLAYPFDFDLGGRSIIVAGKTTLNSDFDGLPKSLAGQQAWLYLPGHDEDHDVVFLQTEAGVTMAKSFSQAAWRKVDDTRLSSAVAALKNSKDRY
jgi:hypothetical protein